MTDFVSEFRAAMSAAGLPTPDPITPDGKLRRVHVEGDRPGSRNGWAVLYGDDLPAGAFGCWKRDIAETWSGKPERSLSANERAEYRRRMEEARKQREAEEEKTRAEARQKATAIWEAAAPAPDDHPYLVRKGVKAHGLRQHKGALVIPMRSADGTLQSLQFISAEGQKLFLTGGQKKGCYFSIGQATAMICIAEGYATGASIHEATGHAVVVAFDAGNLEPVATAIRAKFPDARLVICADNDRFTDGNPGLTKARAAAEAVGGLLAVPDFPADAEGKPTDFNDLVALAGLETVKRAIEAAKSPMEESHPETAKPLPPDDTVIQRLACLSMLEYDRVRKSEAESLRVRPGTLDKMVAAARKDIPDSGIDFDDVEPHPESVDPAKLLTDIAATIRRFIVCAEETAIAVALWVAMTWFIDVVQVAPLAVITAPEKRCGKSQLLFLLSRLVYRPLTASNISPAALFRSIDAWKPTILVDEADSFMKENEELRGLLNCGHTRESAYIVRVVGDDHTPTKFNVWGAKAIAGIGYLADTLMDRAIVLELRRKLPHENVERLRHAEPDLFEVLAAKLARFAEDHRGRVRCARPSLPDKLNDRAQDNWEPLLAIADVAGGEWPKMACKAALHISGGDQSQSIGTELLADIQEIFTSKPISRISTRDLIKALCQEDDKAWATFNRGNPISPRQVAKRLKDFGITPSKWREGYDTVRGYEKVDCADAFARYLVVPFSTSATAPQNSNDATLDVADTPPRSGNQIASATPKPAWNKGCGGVADKIPGADENIPFFTEAEFKEVGLI